ncbi:hypothetical protein FHU13_002261 [Methylobacterium sp. R2-1]|nr:hypothetical protein [Methylobacterium sp. R2-1]
MRAPASAPRRLLRLGWPPTASRRAAKLPAAETRFGPSRDARAVLTDRTAGRVAQPVRPTRTAATSAIEPFILRRGASVCRRFANEARLARNGRPQAGGAPGPVEDVLQRFSDRATGRVRAHMGPGGAGLHQPRARGRGRPVAHRPPFRSMAACQAPASWRRDSRPVPSWRKSGPAPGFSGESGGGLHPSGMARRRGRQASRSMTSLTEGHPGGWNGQARTSTGRSRARHPTTEGSPVRRPSLLRGPA